MRALAFRPVARLVAAAVLVASLTACALQPRDQVRVAIGSGPSVSDGVRSYAALYVPYAMMATAAYSDRNVLNLHNCPDPIRLANRALARDDADFAFHQTVRTWVAQLQARN